VVLVVWAMLTEGSKLATKTNVAVHVFIGTNLAVSTDQGTIRPLATRRGLE